MKKLLIFALFLMISATFSLSAKEKKVDQYQDDYAEAKIFFDGGKLNFQSKDGRFKAMLNNCIDIAAATYLPSKSLDGLEYSNSSLSGDDGEFKFSSGIIVRRVRLGTRIQLYDKVIADIDIDFDHRSVDPKDVAIRYQFHENFSIRAGHIKEPLSIDQQVSWFFQNTLERSMAIQAFTGGRRIGFSGIGFGEHWWASVGVFGARLTSTQKEENLGNTGIGGATRIAYIPIKNENTTLHIGLGASYRKPDAAGDENRTLGFFSRGESNVDGHSFVQWSVGGAGKGGYVSNYETVVAEVAFRHKKLLLMGEYTGTSINRYDLTGVDNSRVNLGRSYISGWYGMASYMILGDQRSYVEGEAEFGAMKVRKKSGNLEIMARISGIDFNDEAIAGYEIYGGSAINYSASLNWYPLSNLLLGLNYIYMDNDAHADSSGGITYNGDLLNNSTEWRKGIDYSTIQMRVALSF